MLLKDQVAIVTGGGQGIGKAISKLFALKGASVVIAERNQDQGRATAEEVRAAAGKTLYVQTDVASDAQVRAMVEMTVRTFGRLDILINNAAVDTKKPILETTEEEWDFVLDVNLKGQFLCAKASAPHMISRGRGSIVNMSSVIGLRSELYFASYCASKAGVLGLTRSMVVEWAPRGIRVNCILPGPIDTPMKWRYVKEDKVEDVHRAVQRSVPLGRFGSPDEVAQCALWLCTEAASYACGSFIEIDGGIDTRYSL
jgi:3-oxoacyl-[acyl-carrier protein] reductase